MAYTSAFTGAQMDAVFRRVTNTVVGRASIVSGSSSAVALVNVPGFSNPYCIGTLRYETEIGIGSPVGVYLRYIPESEQLYIRIVGSGLVSGCTYDVDYMVTE